MQHNQNHIAMELAERVRSTSNRFTGPRITSPHTVHREWIAEVRDKAAAYLGRELYRHKCIISAEVMGKPYGPGGKPGRGNPSHHA